MAFFKCDQAPATAPGDLFWETPDSVVEVTDPVLIADLGKIAWFHEVEAPAPVPAPKTAKPATRTPVEE